jgi:glyoxylase-like metal-dependent hydrolase (beta-lactamase superfamily II)
MLQGSGGNIGVLSGSEGFLLVDAGIAVSQAKILGALAQLGTGKPRYAITTHWHWDHADGNSWVRAAGGTVIAHTQAVRRLKQTIRVVEWQHTFTPIAAEALPNAPIDKPGRSVSTARRFGSDPMADRAIPTATCRYISPRPTFSRSATPSGTANIRSWTMSAAAASIRHPRGGAQRGNGA